MTASAEKSNQAAASRAGWVEPAILVVIALLLVATVTFYAPWGGAWVAPVSVMLLAAVLLRLAKKERVARLKAAALAGELAAANTRLVEQEGRLEAMAMVEERNRVAREIHGRLGHFLMTITVQLEAAQAVHATHAGLALGAVAKAHALAHEGLVEVRRSVSVETAGRPLIEQLRGLAAEGAGLAVEVRSLGTARVLGAEVEQGLFRAAEEGLANVRKHAAARRVSVELDFREIGRVRMSVVDDGRGVAVESGQASGGGGLAELRGRVVRLGGAVRAENRPGGGFVLSVEVVG